MGCGFGKPKPSISDLKIQSGLTADESATGISASKNKTLRRTESCFDIITKKAILVACRVRPFNGREKSSHCKSALSLSGAKMMTLNAPSCGSKEFTFDCVLPMESTQFEVYERTALPVLLTVLDGFNGCVFAYGQTGSGKTYTMQGYGNDIGVIPLLCADLFTQIAKRKDHKYMVSLSLLEIYNEHLSDLLVETEKGGDMDIMDECFPGGRGMFVAGLTETPVSSTKEILKLVDIGQARRSVGKTNMNEHSSRSHAVLTLRVDSHVVSDKDGDSRTISKLHLVDLAGSERQKSTGATGKALKEGAQINLSLSALGNVINALTSTSGGGEVAADVTNSVPGQVPAVQARAGPTTTHIPYRDSKLTRLLQDSLGGNAHTAMICNVSPADDSAEETLSCLRFADRAKHIKNVAKKGRDAKSEKIANLLTELKKYQEYAHLLEKYY